METLAPKVMDRKLKRLFLIYLLSGSFFLASFSSAFLLFRYGESLSNTLDKLGSLKMGLMRLVKAENDMKSSIAAIRSIIPSAYFEVSPDRLILMGLDGVKSRMKSAEITVSEFSYKENEVALPVVLKGTVEDYAAFVNDVAYLQAMKFPFFSINSLLLKKSDEPGPQPVLYEIAGDMRLLKSTPNPEKAGTKTGAPQS